MTDIMASLFVDVHLSKAKQNWFRDGNCFLIAYTVSAYPFRQMFLGMVVEGSIRSVPKALYDCRSSWFDIVLNGIWAESHPNMRSWFHVSWWNLGVSKYLATSLECFVCHFGQYRSTWMSNMSFLCELTIVISRLPCLLRMGKAVSSTVELVNSVTSNSAISFYIAMWAFASKCLPIVLVPCSDGWQRAW